jgi:hypothetical protein
MEPLMDMDWTLRVRSEHRGRVRSAKARELTGERIVRNDEVVGSDPD